MLEPYPADAMPAVATSVTVTSGWNDDPGLPVLDSLAALLPRMSDFFRTRLRRGHVTCADAAASR